MQYLQLDPYSVHTLVTLGDKTERVWIAPTDDSVRHHHRPSQTEQILLLWISWAT